MTTIDIPGIKVGVATYDLPHSTDTAHEITIKDLLGNKVKVTISFGRITSVDPIIKK